MVPDLSDSSLRLKRINIPHAKNAHWPIEKKIEAVTTWLALGNLRQVAAVTGVSYGMMKQWRIASWWKDIEAEIIASRRVAQSNKLSKIVDKSLNVIDDRLDNGDIVLNNKTGELVRKPVTLRDATTAANALMQRAAILEKMQLDNQVADTQESINDQLKNLALEFAKMNNRSKAGAEEISYKETANAIHEERESFPIEKDLGDAIHEKWETRLQEGSGEIHVEAFSGEEEDGTERGTPGNGEGGESP